MSRDILPFIAPDLSALAKTLGRELDLIDGKPGHVQLLNMLARGIGFRNFQHLRAGRRGGAAPRRTTPRPRALSITRRSSGSPVISMPMAGSSAGRRATAIRVWRSGCFGRASKRERSTASSTSVWSSATIICSVITH